jgi:hypothetical protein
MQWFVTSSKPAWQLYLAVRYGKRWAAPVGLHREA